MRIINFGSLNIDKVYQVEQFVRPGQTITAKDYAVAAGGKGLNQSLAAARAGAEVLHAGAIGAEGRFMADLLRESGADTSRSRTTGCCCRMRSTSCRRSSAVRMKRDCGWYSIRLLCRRIPKSCRLRASACLW